MTSIYSSAHLLVIDNGASERAEKWYLVTVERFGCFYDRQRTLAKVINLTMYFDAWHIHHLETVFFPCSRIRKAKCSKEKKREQLSCRENEVLTIVVRPKRQPADEEQVAYE